MTVSTSYVATLPARGPGMDESTARRRAQELAGIAVAAHRDDTGRWNTTPAAPGHDTWIVTSLARRIILDDGHTPAADTAAQTLQTAASRLLDAGTDPDDIETLMVATRAHYAAHVLDVARRNGLPTANPAVYRGAEFAAHLHNLVPFTLSPPAADDHKHVRVTALDDFGQPARDAAGNTWQHCGVCGERMDAPGSATV
ncbi:hypothetical protein [Streptomyces griseoaurantiacus]|uniref:hypothetical protein n=1 Tax=Streptomyces griseoaurantiacus TaxID=68213 RepID=UPI0036CD4E7B